MATPWRKLCGLQVFVSFCVEYVRTSSSWLIRVFVVALSHVACCMHSVPPHLLAYNGAPDSTSTHRAGTLLVGELRQMHGESLVLEAQ